MELKPRHLYVTDHDFRRLSGLVKSATDLRSRSTEKGHLRILRKDLEQANVISAGEIVPQVITMNTRFRVRDLDTSHEGEYTLVFPGRADISRGRLSILAPMGAALLGAQASETISVLTPVGKRQL